MNSKLSAAAAAALLVLGAAHATSADKPSAPRQCFWNHQVNSFAAQSDRAVNLRVGVKDYYQLELFAPCPDVEWTQKIALISRGSSTICSGLDAEVVTPTPIGPQKCLVRNVRKLTPAEVAALPKGARP